MAQKSERAHACRALGSVLTSQAVSSDAPKERIVALGPIRHACHACGSCCTGWRVKVADLERERILAHAAALGVPDPLDGRALRSENGSCVFLGADRLCRIHARFGADEKPLVCQVFPRMATRGEDFVRIGVDPGCSSTWRTYRDGPELDFPLVAAPKGQPLPPELAQTERSLIHLCNTPGMSLARLVGIVSGQQHAPKFPPGFLKRLLAPMKGLDFLLTHPDAGPLLVADFAKATTFIRLVDADRPPRLEVSKEMSALTLETLQRTLFLRIGDDTLPPMGKLVLLVAGAVVCAYAYKTPERFGRGLAAWSRLSRVPGFWEPFIPDVESARYIMTGVRA
jgi:Fe-S-cluster containining protein